MGRDPTASCMPLAALAFLRQVHPNPGEDRGAAVAREVRVLEVASA